MLLHVMMEKAFPEK